MAWTKDDQKCVEDAIRELVAGKRIVQVDLGGRVEVYTPVRLQEFQNVSNQDTGPERDG